MNIGVFEKGKIFRLKFFYRFYFILKNDKFVVYKFILIEMIFIIFEFMEVVIIVKIVFLEI